MEFIRTTLHGAEINVIFTGEYYYFHNSFFGLVGIAHRQGYDEESSKTFDLITGNEHCTGGSYTPATVEMMMKKVINKNESRYIPTSCKWLHSSLPLQAVTLDIKHKRY